MSKEKDFFKTCFNIVAGLEVKNESQAISKEVVLSEIEKLQQENKQLKEIYKDLFNTYQKLKKENEEVTLLNLYQVDKIQQLEDNWNKLKEYIKENTMLDDYGIEVLNSTSLKNYMQKLEEGSDNYDTNR